MIRVVANAEQLRAALKEIEIAEANGIMHCDAIFELVSTGRSVGDSRLQFDRLIVKGHPTDPAQNWGCYDHYKNHKYMNGDLVEIE